MTEETKMILDRLDLMSQEIKETKEIALEARDAAREAKTIALEARDAAREAKAIALEARDMAKEAMEIAKETCEALKEVKVIAMGAVAIANETKEEVKELKKEVKQIRVMIEEDLRKQIQIIGEGHDFLKSKLDMAINMEKERERMWLEIVNLRMDMRIVKEKLCIA